MATTDGDYREGGRLHPASWRGVPLTTLIRLLRDALPTGRRDVIQALNRRIEVHLLYKTRVAVSKKHPNEGDDIVTAVHSKLGRAVLDPGSGDYHAVSSHLKELIDRRVKDELRRSARLDRIDCTAMEDVEASADPGDLESAMEIERALNKVEDRRKVMAFRMWCSGESKASIAGTLRKDPSTIGQWIKDVTRMLRKELGS